MSDIKIIQNSINYIEQNLKSKLTVTKLAHLSGYSQYHYYRLFNAYVGIPVMQYIRRRRMIHALNELMNKNKRIIDVALDYGFDTHSGFSKAFNKEYGCSPRKYVKHLNGTILDQIDLSLFKKYKLKGGIIMDPKIIHCSSFKVAGYEMKTSLEYKRSEREIPAFWERFEIDCWEEKLYKQIKPDKHDEYAICFPPDMETSEFNYILGVNAKGNESLSKDMVFVEIPEATFAVFTTPPSVSTISGFAESIKRTWDYILYEWFPKSNYEIAANKPDFEFYDERCHGNKSVVMDIYIPVINKTN